MVEHCTYVPEVPSTLLRLTPSLETRYILAGEHNSLQRLRKAPRLPPSTKASGSNYSYTRQREYPVTKVKYVSLLRIEPDTIEFNILSIE
jgi:hypothetical protein